ncbi:hypothetical protein [Streptomonospora litoralis]|uniref:Uncharacterized protein n=1 Tax=Streptomonospora litoralis TaxID=2498135 RepID=A0A4P6Q7R7_9ACTN|nr:hypothetical protein [Streptomonospora litoralis]QBI56846.1 hypothetical protein EKD16_25530 [Streptomonospora litoralis]
MSPETFLMWTAGAILVLVAIGLAVVIVLFALHNLPFGPVQHWKKMHRLASADATRYHDLIHETATALGKPHIAVLLRPGVVVEVARERMRELEQLRAEQDGNSR